MFWSIIRLFCSILSVVLYFTEPLIRAVTLFICLTQLHALFDFTQLYGLFDFTQRSELFDFTQLS